MTFDTKLLVALESERRRAQAVVDACDLALNALRQLGDIERTAAPAKAAASPKPRRVAKQSARAGGSRCGTCAAGILAFLSRPGSPREGVEGKHIRQAVAKALGLNAKDDDTATDLRNALSFLKAKGQITRSGTIWSLTDKAREHAA